MLEEKKQVKHLELQSEKMRSIIGQIPSKLTRYGISIITFVIIMLLIIASFLPYKRVYSGIATIHSVYPSKTDSTQIFILLKFEGARPIESKISNNTLKIHTFKNITVIGKVQKLSGKRDALGYQKSICLFPSNSLKTIENNQTDFTLEENSGNILKNITKMK